MPHCKEENHTNIHSFIDCSTICITFWSFFFFVFFFFFVDNRSKRPQVSIQEFLHSCNSFEDVI